MLHLYGYAALGLTNRLVMAARKMKWPLCGELEAGTQRSRGGVFFLPAGEKTQKPYTKKKIDKRRAITFPPFALA